MKYYSIKNLILLFTALFFFSQQSQGSFLIDPYLGFKLASGENSNNLITEYEYNSLTYGSRLGLKFLGFSGGLDYSLSSVEMEASTGNTTITDDHEQKSFGVFVGYDFPIMMRIWATYFFDINYEDTDGTDKGDELNGSGLGLGAGWTILPLVSLNLEYRMISLDESVTSGVTNSLTGDDEIEINELLFSVSIPLEF